MGILGLVQCHSNRINASIPGKTGTNRPEFYPFSKAQVKDWVGIGNSPQFSTIFHNFINILFQFSMFPPHGGHLVTIPSPAFRWCHCHGTGSGSAPPEWQLVLPFLGVLRHRIPTGHGGTHQQRSGTGSLGEAIEAASADWMGERCNIFMARVL